MQTLTKIFEGKKYHVCLWLVYIYDECYFQIDIARWDEKKGEYVSYPKKGRDYQKMIVKEKTKYFQKTIYPIVSDAEIEMMKREEVNKVLNAPILLTKEKIPLRHPFNAESYISK